MTASLGLPIRNRHREQGGPSTTSGIGRVHSGDTQLDGQVAIRHPVPIHNKRLAVRVVVVQCFSIPTLGGVCGTGIVGGDEGVTGTCPSTKIDTETGSLSWRPSDT